jgi:uncharacterized protein (UPF0248 family)
MYSCNSSFFVTDTLRRTLGERAKIMAASPIAPAAPSAATEAPTHTAPKRQSSPTAQSTEIPTVLNTPQPNRKLRPVHDILHRLRWDPKYASQDGTLDLHADDNGLPARSFLIEYKDRFDGIMDMPFEEWLKCREVTSDEFVPMHRIVRVCEVREEEVEVEVESEEREIARDDETEDNADNENADGERPRERQTRMEIREVRDVLWDREARIDKVFSSGNSIS